MDAKLNGANLSGADPYETAFVNADLTSAVGLETCDFLGYHFEAGKRWPRNKSRKKLRDTIRAKTKRTSGHSMTQIIAEVNRTLRGWFEYFKHSYRPTFRMEDGFVRRRLRSILRRRNRQKGSAKANGADQTRWTNAYFAELRLFSLQQAHVAACQSSCR